MDEIHCFVHDINIFVELIWHFCQCESLSMNRFPIPFTRSVDPLGSWHLGLGILAHAWKCLQQTVDLIRFRKLLSGPGTVILRTMPKRRQRQQNGPTLFPTS